MNVFLLEGRGGHGSNHFFIKKLHDVTHPYRVKLLLSWLLWSSGKYVYSKRVKKQSRNRPTNQSIWLYHVLLNERFTHTDH